MQYPQHWSSHINNLLFHLEVSECPHQWNKLNDHCYYISEKSVSGFKVKTECEDRNAKLVVPKSLENNEAINRAKNERKIGSAWIGLVRVNGNFETVGGHELPY